MKGKDEMKKWLNKRIKETKISAIREFSDKVQHYDDGINLTIGQPDFHTPDFIKLAGKNAIDQNKTFYTSTAGIEGLRKAAANYVKKYHLDYDWRTEIAITNGATQALDTAFRTILEPGSEVILAGPAYPGYQPIIDMCGGRPIFVDTTRNDFKMTADLIEPYITEKTRAILLSYPSNPTGTVLHEQELKEIATLAQDKDIFIISDEIYSELIYESNHCSIASFPEVRNQTIVIHGLSKSFSMTGWRIGMVYAPEYMMEEMLKVLLFNASCVNSISQEAGIEALHSKGNAIHAMKAEYKERRDYVYSRLVSMKVSASKPQAAFYIFPSVKEFGMSSLAFANQLLQEEHVAVVPGSSFSVEGEGYVRISFASSMSVLEKGLNRFERFIQTLKKRGFK